MKVLAISGSPRDGNTEAMLKRVLDGAKEAGASIELVRLRDLAISHCTGCLYCDKTHSCRQQDEMAQLLSKLINSDVIVLGTPSYFDNVSGLLKDFIDRTNPFYQVFPLKGKKMAGIVCGGQKTSDQKVVKLALKGFAEMQKMEYVGEVTAQAETPKEVLKNGEKMLACFELGKKLARQK